MPETDLTADHKPLSDEPVARAYFAKFDRITAHLANVAKVMQGERTLTETDTAILAGYLAAMAASFRALGMKYLISGRLEGVTQRHLTMDVHESGFPVFQEIVTLANDAAQADTHLKDMPDEAHLKSEMIRQIVAERTVPLQLQYAHVAAAVLSGADGRRPVLCADASAGDLDRGCGAGTAAVHAALGGL